MAPNPYACNLCTLSFPIASLLVSHVQFKHDDSKIKTEGRTLDPKVHITDKKIEIQDASNDQSQNKKTKTSFQKMRKKKISRNKSKIIIFSSQSKSEGFLK